MWFGLQPIADCEGTLGGCRRHREAVPELRPFDDLNPSQNSGTRFGSEVGHR